MGVELAAILTAVAGMLAGFYGFIRWHTGDRDKLYAARIEDLEEILEELRSGQADMRKNLEAYAHKNRLMEIQLDDYVRHTHRLERIMQANGLEVPEFIPTRTTGATV